MNRSSLLFALLVPVLLISSCKKSTSTTSTVEQQADPSSSAPSQPRDDQKLAALDKLESYYEALEAEDPNIDGFFAPQVENFFGKPLSREQVGQSLRNGFTQVDGRKITVDPSQLTVSTDAAGNSEVEFFGEVSFMRLATREQVKEPVHNRVLFDPSGKIISYESLPLTNTRGMAMDATSSDPMAEARQVAEEILAIFQKGNLQKLDAYFPRGVAPVLMARTGAYSIPAQVSSSADINAKAPWLAQGMPGLSTRIQSGDFPSFDCDRLFSKQGTFMGSISNGYDAVSSLMQEIQESELETYQPEAFSSILRMEALVSVQVVDTQSALSFCLGQQDGKWKLLIIDLASFDCSA
ncbi:MAG: hypothetical protein NWR72_18515 [Bacteroidia bacterium]|nr:hypothetical protein [Bacteroidia bacterium]